MDYILAWFLVLRGKQIFKTMKTILNLWIFAMIAVLSSCISETGPVGPQGPQGEQGLQGESGYVFEYEDVDFTAPEYEVFLPFPDDFESLNSDVALVYLLWDVVKVDDVDTEVWRQVPQNIITNEGLLQYNFDFSMLDVRLFMDAEFNMDLLAANDTDDWVVRVVIVPGDFWNSARLSSSELSYSDVKEMLGLPDLATPNIGLDRRK